MNQSSEKCLPEGRFDNEPRLDLGDFYIGQEESIKKVRDFKSRFESKDSIGLNLEMDKVEMSYFAKLQDDAKEEAINNVVNGEVEDVQFITAFRIILGMSELSLIEVFCEPIFLEIDKENSNKRKVRTFIRNLDNEPCYQVIDNKLKAVTAQVKNKSAKLYRKQILIDHLGNGEYESFEEGRKWLHDTKSIVFSFQELFCLYHTNHSPGPVVGSEDYKEKISIVNAASFKGKRPIKLRRYKHTIIIKTGSGKEKAFLSPDLGDDGNLGHLCPPSRNCDGIEYDL